LQTSNPLDYIDPILTTFDPKPFPSTSAPAPQVKNITAAPPPASAAAVPQKVADFLYEMSEENLVGMGGDSSVEAYLVTKQGLNIPPTAILPMGCKIEVQKSLGMGEPQLLLEGRVCGYNELTGAYDVQYEEGGREFDVPRSVILVMGERPTGGARGGGQEQPPTKPPPSATIQHSLALPLSTSREQTFTLTLHSLSVNGLKHSEFLDGENDPYALLSFGDHWKIKTEVLEEGGSDVVWDLDPTVMQFESTAQMFQLDRIRVDVYDRNQITRDTLIGSGEKMIQHLIQGPSLGTETRLNIQLVDSKNRATGTAILTLVVNQTTRPPSASGSGSGAGSANPSPRKVTSSSSSAAATASTSRYRVGEEVEGNYQRGGSWYAGVIISGTGDRYRIRYRDGDEEGQVLEENIRYPQPTQQTKPPHTNTESEKVNTPTPERSGTSAAPPLALYEISNRVEANYRSRGKWFPGTVSDVVRELEGQGQGGDGYSYTVDYDDGEVEAGVAAQNLKLLPTKSPTPTGGGGEVPYNIDSFLDDADDEEDEGGGGAAGLTTNDLLDDNYFQQLQQQREKEQQQAERQSPTESPAVKRGESRGGEGEGGPVIRQLPSVDINSFLAGLSDGEEEDGDLIGGGGVDGGDSINLDYGVCAPEEGAGEEEGDQLNQTNDYGDDFDD
jgi:hypothetical protein